MAAHEPDVAERHAVLLDASLFRMSQEVKDQQATEKKEPAGNHAMSPDPLPEPLFKVLSIMSLELRASMLATAKQRAGSREAVCAARGARKRIWATTSLPSFIRPAAETEAAAMMNAGKWAEAKAASKAALVERPNSGFALYGIAQATEKSGDAGATTVAYKQFLSAWKTADPGLPQVGHAQQWLSQHAATGDPGP